MQDALKIWNQAVGLTKPTLREFERAIGGVKWVPVFDHAPSFLYAGSNILVNMHPAWSGSKSSPIVSISLILVSDYFQGPTTVKTVDLSGIELFSIPLKGSASSVLKALRDKGVTQTETMSEMDRWTICHGRALGLDFRAVGEGEPNADRSKITCLQFYFQIPYASSIWPILGETLP